MSKIRVIPVILLKNNNVVQSTNFSTHKIVGDPIALGPSPGNEVWHTSTSGSINPLDLHSIDNYLR